MADQLQTRASDAKNPLLFISHRQDDKELADTLNEWITHRASGNVEVFQHDSTSAKNLRIGAILSVDLAKNLREAGVVVLLFTAPEKDWSYCMFECGVAYDDESKPTRVIVFQCAGFAPRVFESQVCVDVHNETSVFNFVNSFLTDHDFFPRRGRPVSGFSAKSDEVRIAADDLFKRFRPYQPAGGGEWPTHPFVSLAVAEKDWKSVDDVEDEDEQIQLARTVFKNALVKAADDVGNLFGTRQPLSKSLGELLDIWKRQRKQKDDPLWYEGLCRQMIPGERAALIRWDLMRSAEDNDQTWYAPAVMRVRKVTVSGQRFNEYDIYFCRFNKTRNGAVEIGVSSIPSTPAPSPRPDVSTDRFRDGQPSEDPAEPGSVADKFKPKGGSDAME